MQSAYRSFNEIFIYVFFLSMDIKNKTMNKDFSFETLYDV